MEKTRKPSKLTRFHHVTQLKKNPSIVFLHGLRGNREKTWAKNGVVWPKDLLPNDIPASRIFLFGYDTNITSASQSGATKTEIHSDAEDVCAKLAAERSSTQTVSNLECNTSTNPNANSWTWK